jgi:hypothetical protein
MPLNPSAFQALIACNLQVATRCCIPLPGGASLCGTGLEFDPIRLLAPYIAQLNAALAPLMPIFRLLAVVLAIVNCIKAIPQSIPVPEPVIKCLIDLLAAVVELLKLIPFISLPFTLLAILDCIIAFLGAIETTLLRIQAQVNACQLVIDAGIPAQVAIATCELNAMQVHLNNINNLLFALGTILGVFNLLAGLIGLPQIPTKLSVGANINELGTVAAQIDQIRQPLVQFRALIPVH